MTGQGITKTCSKCGETKTLDLFAKNSYGRGGLSTHCKECKRARSLQWYHDNRERANARLAAWKTDSPKFRASQAKARAQRRAREFDAVCTTHPGCANIDRNIVWVMAGGRCGICLRTIDRYERWDIEHRVPLAKGGLHCLDNLDAAHSLCNQSKGGRIANLDWLRERRAS